MRFSETTPRAGDACLTVRPAIDGARAAALLRRGAPWRRGISAAAAQRLELAPMPFACFEVGLVRGRGESAPRRACLVDRIGGHAFVIDPLLVATLEPRQVSCRPRLSLEESRRVAARFVARADAVWSLRGKRAVTSPPTAGTAIGYPFWLMLYERRDGRVDLRALDAVSGAVVGAQLRASIVAALVASPAGTSAAPAGHEAGP